MKTTRQFYKEIGPKGLAARKSKKMHQGELNYLKKLLNKKQRILDLACGYGRITIPLAKQGYNIRGIDISPNLIKEAKRIARKNKLDIEFRIGDMRKLPYKDRSFDVILVLWSAFTELLNKNDQVKALKEMLRVLDFGGFVTIDLPYLPRRKKYVKIGGDEFISRGNLTYMKISGIASVNYYFTKKSLKELMRKAKIKKYRVFIDKFGGRNRLFLQFLKRLR
jgi:ubiquinone/menaquinone biosynthesis C-methylase UbiE